MINFPLVSVCTATYNHAKYISQCLDSLLMQKTDFEYEMLIGEDDSKDGNRELCIEYAKKYPDKIRLFLNDRKNVIYINGRPTGRWNFINLLKNAKGKYIAICPGDDYWTVPNKLQKQADFLEKNPHCSICFHNAYTIREPQNVPSGKYGPSIYKPFFTLEDLLYQNFLPTSSVLFRNKLFDEFPPWYWTVPMGDWPLHLLNAQFGDIGYFHETMSCFRIHDKGIWHSRSLAEQLTDILETYEIFKLHFQNNAKYVGIIQKMITTTALRIAHEHKINNNLDKASLYIKKAVENKT